jgi:hypothetical protein
MSAVENRILRRATFALMEEERASRRYWEISQLHRRQQLDTLMVGEAKETAVRMKEIALAARLESLEQLQKFYNRTVAKEEEERAAKIYSAQQRLEQEFAEIKKMKKAGPPKQPLMPPCSACGQVPPDFFVHRTAECAERPVQCPKCAVILPFSQFEGHKTVCPSRVVQCGACSNHYRASYLEATHARQCAYIKECASRLLKVPPTLPMVIDGSGDGTGVKIHLENDLGVEGVPRDATRLIRINGNVVKSTEDVHRMTSSLRIGESASLTLLTGEGAEETFDVRVRPLGLLLEAYEEMCSLVQTDEAQYCKPQPERPKKKK